VRDSSGKQLKGGKRYQPGANNSQDPISKKKKSHKRAAGVAQGVGPEFKPQYHQKKIKNRKRRGKALGLRE
jgi:hypothetical protein